MVIYVVKSKQPRPAVSNTANSPLFLVPWLDATVQSFLIIQYHSVVLLADEKWSAVSDSELHLVAACTPVMHTLHQQLHLNARQNTHLLLHHLSKPHLVASLVALHVTVFELFLKQPPVCLLCFHIKIKNCVTVVDNHNT